MEITSTPPSCVPPRVAVVGAGRLGAALANALRSAGVEAIGPVGRGPVPDCDIALLCVPDAEIPAAAATAASSATAIGHTSGATGLSAVAEHAAEAFGLHPLQTFAGGESPERFLGVGCAIAGTTSSALATARDLAERLGMRPFEISDDDRAAYHAAASIASNFLITLEAAAEQVAAGAGIEPDDARGLLAPLVRSSVENWAERGPRRALTGPVARGDEQTVERQREAVGAVASELLPLFDELVLRTRALAREEAVA